MRERGWDAHLIALYRDEEGEQQTPLGITWDYVAGRRPHTAVGMVRLVGALARKLRRQAPTAVVTALPAANVIVPIAVTVGKVATKVITTHHTPSQTYLRALDIADAFTGRLSCVRHIVGVSDAVANTLASKPPSYRSKLITIRNAVPPEMEDVLATLAVARRLRPGRGRRLVCSGRLAEQKNYGVVLRSLARLPDVTLEIVGAGPEGPSLGRLAAELGVAQRVVFLGQKTRMETLERVSRGDIFVQMSLFEGNSLSLIEAAKLGIPLIVSDVPEQREGITDRAGIPCGLIVPTHDDRALAEAVRQLLDDAKKYLAFADHSARLGDQIRFEDLVSSYEQLFSKPLS